MCCIYDIYIRILAYLGQRKQTAFQLWAPKEKSQGKWCKLQGTILDQAVSYEEGLLVAWFKVTAEVCLTTVIIITGAILVYWHWLNASHRPGTILGTSVYEFTYAYMTKRYMVFILEREYWGSRGAVNYTYSIYLRNGILNIFVKKWNWYLNQPRGVSETSQLVGTWNLTASPIWVWHLGGAFLLVSLSPSL